jgi:hypothetical protein
MPDHDVVAVLVLDHHVDHIEPGADDIGESAKGSDPALQVWREIHRPSLTAILPGASRQGSYALRGAPAPAPLVELDEQLPGGADHPEDTARHHDDMLDAHDPGTSVGAI